MAKFYFDDRFFLTDMVIEGTKTDTRRIEPSLRQLHSLSQDEKYEVEPYGATIPHTILVFRYWKGALVETIRIHPKYRVGQVVAVAQNYQKAGIPADQIVRLKDEGQNMYSPVIAARHPGWRNKLFTREDLMPHSVDIINARLQHLQDITDDDCMREGVLGIVCESEKKYYVPGIKPPHSPSGSVTDFRTDNRGSHRLFASPREAYAALFNRIEGTGAWDRNPWVLTYSFKKSS